MRSLYVLVLVCDRCTADCGWITGHSYVTYGPLLNGASCIVFEGVITCLFLVLCKNIRCMYALYRDPGLWFCLQSVFTSYLLADVLSI